MRWPESVFTRREAAVVVVVLITVGTMVLVGLNQTRSHARRTTCEAHMRQVTLAVLSFVDQTGRYPHVNSGPLAPNSTSPLGRVAPGAVPAASDDSDSSNWQVDGYSWIVQLLPYLEQPSLYDEIARASQQFEIPAFAPNMPAWAAPQPPAARQFTFLRCPSVPRPRQALPGKRYGLPEGQTLGETSYVALAAATSGVREPGVVDDLDPILGGVIVSSGMHREAQPNGELIPDGASQTLMLVETRQEQFSSWYSGQSAWTVGFPPQETAELRDIPQLFEALTNPNTTPATGLNYGRDLATQQGPWFAESWAGGPRDWGPSSYHPKAVIHSFAGGSVAQLDPSIDPLVYAQLICSGDGQAGGLTKAPDQDP